MRKRRRLANKLTIMVCAVLFVVSAFFYAPMDVSAEEVVSLSTTTDITSNGLERYVCENKGVADSRKFDFSPYLDGDGLYKITFNFSPSYYCLSELSSYPVWLNAFTCINTSDSFYQMSKSSPNWQREFNYNGYLTIYIDSDAPVVQILYFFVAVFKSNVAPTVDFSMNYSISDVVATKVLDEDSQDYQNGYNAGYSAGEEAGYGNGYSNGFADGEASVDTDAIYDEAFQAGIDSVDTQSYYDAGYQAGYDAAYATGYESGYDVGYQSAMDRIENWGADTTDYPLRISSGKDNGYFSVHVGSDIPFNYRDSVTWYNSNDYNPNHTYKYVINFSNLDVGLNSDILYDYWHLYLNIGGIEYILAPFNDTSVSVFIPGDRMSTSYSFDWVLYNCANFVSGDSNLAYLYVDYDFVIYDMGPSGDTQNHIANQTDQLTNGYDDSKGNEVNSELSTGLNEYQSAEDSLWATATTGLKDFTFFDFKSVPAMITGMSFITSIMGSWFSYAGGASGVGIVLSILFSVMLVAMVLGLYRLYQSKGGKK